MRYIVGPFCASCWFVCRASASATITDVPLHFQDGNKVLHCNKEVNNSKSGTPTCIVNATITASSLDIHYPGDIIITQGAFLTTTRGDLRIQANGALMLEGNMTARVQDGSIILIAGTITLNGGASAKVDGNVNITACTVQFAGKATIEAGGGANITTRTGAAISDASIRALEVSLATCFACPKSLQGRSCQPIGNADNVLFSTSSIITAARIHIVANGNVEFNGTLLGLPDPKLTDHFDVAVSILTLRNLTMDLNGGQWNTKFFSVVADKISMLNQTVHSHGTSCQNRPSPKFDQCTKYLQYWPMHPNATPGDIAAAGHQVSAGEITFNVALIARATLWLSDVHLSAGSMLLCSGGGLAVQASRLDTSGGGCGPGEGPGRGTDGADTDPACGAGGGGSHMGRGGAGTTYDATGVAPCAPAGLPYDRYDAAVSALLPTRGASGGGCGLHAPCPSGDAIQAPASAGGLVWLSGNDVSLQGGVDILADGNSGAVTSKPNKSLDVSGGGAGGHILLWVYGFMMVDPAEPVRLSANGGDIQCTKKQVSGAGGGGFIGIQYAGTPIAEKAISMSYRGGSMRDDCKGWPPQQGLSTAFGQAGLASTLLPCPAGRSGPFCQLCPLGTYASAGSRCSDCTNKPGKHSEYTAIGWPNSSCPYKCAPGVPDYRTNNQCLEAPSFVFHFFGGLGGALVILTCLILVSGFFLCRRASHGKRRRTGPLGAESFTGSAGVRHWNTRCSVIGRRLCCSNRAQDWHTDGEHAFTKEQLPYHVCRVYLYGQNMWQFPWGISSHLPAVVQSLVSTEQWKDFADEFNMSAEVPSTDACYGAVLGLVIPPFVAVVTCWQRRRRARLLQKCARRFSEGTDSIVFWKPIRARIHPSGDLAMVFGCDYGATLGFLDFFDFSRSQLDWAPVDLRQDARLLVAQGHGSYSDPLTLDMADPLVTHLAQTDFGTVAVCSVISTFNQISRSIEMSELSLGAQGPKVLRLRQKVQQCAAQCGLGGFVQVLALQQQIGVAPRGPPGGSLGPPGGDTEASFLDLLAPRRGGGGAAQGSARRRPLLPPATAAPTHAAELGGEQPACSAAAVAVHPPPPGGRGSSGGPLHIVAGSLVAEPGGMAETHEAAVAALEVKLCLAFIEPSSLSEGCVSPSSAFSAAACAPPGVLLTSPMARSSLSEHLEQSAIEFLDSTREASSFIRPTSCLQWCWMPSWRDQGSTTPATVLVIVIVLLFTDLLAFSIVGGMLFRISYIVLAVWIFVPPLVQPLALVLGPVFLLSEMPRLGRLYANMSIYSTVSAAVSTVALRTVQQVDSWFFSFVTLLTVCAVKAALYFFTNVHIRNLEAAQDMSFIDAPQADFVGHILSTDSSRQDPRLEDALPSVAHPCPQNSELHGQVPHLQQRAFPPGSSDSFQQLCPLTLNGACPSKCVTPLSGASEPVRHSSGRNREPPLGSSPVEPSPF